MLQEGATWQQITKIDIIEGNLISEQVKRTATANTIIILYLQGCELQI